MLIKTKYFGEIDINEDQIILFPYGVYGFEDEHRFILLSDADDSESPFMWLQSIENRDPCFAVMDPRAAVSAYNPRISDDTLKKLGCFNQSDEVRLLAVTVINSDIIKSTVNLLSPLIINTNKKIAMQEILDSSFPGNSGLKTRHPIFNKSEGVLKC